MKKLIDSAILWSLYTSCVDRIYNISFSYLRLGLCRYFFFGIFLLLLTTKFSFEARADVSCNSLLSDLNQHLQFPPNEVAVLHMTNYQANQQWWGGYTETRLRRSQNGHLVGEGSRLISSRSIDLGGGGPFGGQSQPFSVRNPDPISYDINPQGKITFQGQYGPYEMTCLGNKFVIVNTGDSIETFTFTKSTGPH